MTKKTSIEEMALIIAMTIEKTVDAKLAHIESPAIRNAIRESIMEDVVEKLQNKLPKTVEELVDESIKGLTKSLNNEVKKPSSTLRNAFPNNDNGGKYSSGSGSKGSSYSATPKRSSSGGKGGGYGGK